MLFKTTQTSNEIIFLMRSIIFAESVLVRSYTVSIWSVFVLGFIFGYAHAHDFSKKNNKKKREKKKREVLVT